MNKCGECGVCCKACQIDELNKPAGVMCSHYNGGCTIYEGRPNDCATYKCIWITQENIDVKYRPDHLGVVFEQPFGKKYWVGIELEPDALNKEDCARLVRAMNYDGASVILKSLTGTMQYSLPQNKTLEQFLKEYN